MVLGYFENYGKDEVPSESIWHHPTRLEEWFEAVEQRRGTDMQPIDGPAEEAEMEGNLFAHEVMEGSHGD